MLPALDSAHWIMVSGNQKMFCKMPDTYQNKFAHDVKTSCLHTHKLSWEADWYTGAFTIGAHIEPSILIKMIFAE